MTHVEQDLPIATDGPHLHDLVGADLRVLAALGGDTAAEMLAERKKIGVERYGQPLQAHNGRDALRDAREEALDLLVYLRQAIEEGREDLAHLYEVALRLACQLIRRSTSKDRSIGS